MKSFKDNDGNIRGYIIRKDARFVDFPADGVNIAIDTYDDLGLLEPGLTGNTAWRWDGMGWKRRSKIITKQMLIRELLGLDFYL